MAGGADPDAKARTLRGNDDELLDSVEAAISSRKGDESKRVSRAYFFHRAKRAGTFDGYRSWVLKAVTKKPNDFFALEEIAEASIGKVDAETTKEHHRQAKEARLRGLEAYRKANPGEVPTHIQKIVDEDLLRFGVFEQISHWLGSQTGPTRGSGI